MILRNPEIKKFMLVQTIVCLVLFAISFGINIYAGLMVLVVSVVLNLIFMVFTAHRYGKIKELVMFLTRISNGEYGLDVRDKREGELRIHKNEI